MMDDALLDLVTLLPELILTATVLTVITTDLFLPRSVKWLLTPLSVFGMLLAGIGVALTWDVNDTVFAGFYVVDNLGVW
jgi:NADH:ubiquinone oxidoreductase subunit 2 (subunit N)